MAADCSLSAEENEDDDDDVERFSDDFRTL
jgi:hypothetical protein